MSKRGQCSAISHRSRYAHVYGNLQLARPCCTTPDKSRIIFTLSDFNPPLSVQIYRINSDGTGLINLTNNTANQYQAEDISPDGKRILFAANNFFGLQTMNVDGGDVKQIEQGRFLGNPFYSPDGRKIVFASPSGIKVMDADGAKQKSLTSTPSGSGFGDLLPSWNPTGRKIVFARLSQTANITVSDLYTIDTDGKNLRRITEGSDVSTLDVDPVFVPYGDAIIFTHIEPNSSSFSNVYRVAIKKHFLDFSQLTSDGGSENPYILPTFDLTGRFVYYTSNSSGPPRIYRVPIGGGNPTLLATGQLF
jgi:Tol biopolymer transport system component